MPIIISLSAHVKYKVACCVELNVDIYWKYPTHPDTGKIPT